MRIVPNRESNLELRTNFKLVKRFESVREMKVIDAVELEVDGNHVDECFI